MKQETKDAFDMNKERSGEHVSLQVAPEEMAEEGILQPKYARKIQERRAEHGIYEFMIKTIGSIQGFIGSIPCIFCIPSPYKSIEQGNVGLIEEFGKCIAIVDPGLHKINPWSESILQLSIKLRLGDVPSQYVMTKDNVGITIDSVLTYHIFDAYAAAYLVADVHSAMIERTQTILRQAVGMRLLQDCIEHRDALTNDIMNLIAEPASRWGVKIDAILIKDMSMPKDVVENLSAAARQRRVGEGRVIAAEAEVKAAELIKKAAVILSSNAAMQIRYLDTMVAMSKTPGTRVIFSPQANGIKVATSTQNNDESLVIM